MTKDESALFLPRRWKLSDDGFGVQRDDKDGNYVYASDALEVIERIVAERDAAEKDAERLRNGEVIGFRKDDYKGRAWWSGGTWLNKGQEVIVVDAIDAQEPK
jgi:hypothetical protein